MEKRFCDELIRTGLIHRPLKLETVGSVEDELLKKEVRNQRILWGKETSFSPVHTGQGKILTESTSCDPILVLTGDNITYCWPETMSPDGDCAFYGTVHATFPFDNENWEEYHRITFWVKPECPGMHVVNINVGICNDGEIKVPDEYYREGTHVVNLVNHEWNQCVWEFGSMARDCITELDFSCRLNGKDTTTGDYVRYEIKNVCLETCNESEPDTGWLCRPEEIAYSSTGYFLDGDKIAITGQNVNTFSIRDAVTKQTIYTGKAKKQCFQDQEYSILDFSSIDKEGKYILQVGDKETKPFRISEHVYEEALWKVINFLFCERCGYPVPEKHGLCHLDVVAEFKGNKLSFGGGWHDAGDMSQQMIHTAEVSYSLFEMARTLEEKVKDNALYELLYGRLLEEAKWGLEFVLRTRMEDGYRATSAGLVRWTNGVIGDEDDVIVRWHNHAFENLLCAGICAASAQTLEKDDKELACRCMEVAKEDFQYGIERFETVGMELPIMWEHTYSSSKSQYYACIVWSSALIYQLTNDEYYKEYAVTYADKLLECQEQGSNQIIRGYYYRDETKSTIVHYSHQSREYMFTDAFRMLCITMPNHEKLKQWENAMKLYGEYLKKLMIFASPYKMLPAGVYHESEIEDKDTFSILHLLVDYEKQKEHYREQLRQGTHLGDGYYIRNFPVWFSFRGNTAIHLAMGKAAATIGKYFNDSELTQVAREQLYWITGKNPFHQSLIYGEGERYGQQYAVMPGEMVGEMPVGIQTNGDEDVPYWPHNNNATYKEVWTSSACRWLMVLSELSN